MLKITKGLKKKKKGKKNKHKEDELFDSAELEQYRREQQQKQEQGTAETSEAADSEKSEEWEKFKALTSGVDDILKKTQGDLDRIKSTSYFQKKAAGPSVSESSEVIKAEVKPPKGRWVGFEDSINVDENDEAECEENKAEEALATSKKEEEIVEEVEEEESELEDDQDDIFDTSYVDVVASGEVKLAYVPDSPIQEEEEGFDPFDTSIVDKVIKTDPKKRNLVSLGCAVEVLTGKVEKTTPASETVKSQRRRPRTQDLLLDSFEEDEPQIKVDVDAEPAPKSILDDDPVFAEETSAILEFPTVTQSFEKKVVSTPPEEQSRSTDLDLKNLVEEFVPCELTEDAIKENVELKPEDELDDEFAALAAESLAKIQQKFPSGPPKPPRLNLPKVNPVSEEEEIKEFEIGDDPFDTSFAAQVLPGKYELKLIEKEILAVEENEKFNPIETAKKFNVKLNINIQLNSANDFGFSEDELKEQEPLSLKHRDLLGGSTTDLSKITQSPIAPKTVEINQKDITNDDPFDTSIINELVAPGKTELKFLEQELLTEEKSSLEVEIDNDFDPRAEENLSKPLNRPDNLEVGEKRISVPKIVAFDIKSPSNLPDLLSEGLAENSKVSKPLTPYYPPNKASQDKCDFDSTVDPFDTSFVTNFPGKLELKLIEQELTLEKTELKRSLSDPDFDPRAGTDQDTQLSTIPQQVAGNPSQQPDIISEEVNTEAKLHTPVIPKKISEVFEESKEFDPFDTSIANILAPGKVEIKILETELIYAKENPPINTVNNIIAKTLTKKFSETKPVTDVLEQPSEDITVKPLTPVAASSLDQQDFDPFDTSRVAAILPGKTEIKLLESELLN